MDRNLRKFRNFPKVYHQVDGIRFWATHINKRKIFKKVIQIQTNDLWNYLDWICVARNFPWGICSLSCDSQISSTHSIYKMGFWRSWSYFLWMFKKIFFIFSLFYLFIFLLFFETSRGKWKPLFRLFTRVLCGWHFVYTRSKHEVDWNENSCFYFYSEKRKAFQPTKKKTPSSYHKINMFSFL